MLPTGSGLVEPMSEEPKEHAQGSLRFSLVLKDQGGDTLALLRGHWVLNTGHGLGPQRGAARSMISCRGDCPRSTGVIRHLELLGYRPHGVLCHCVFCSLPSESPCGHSGMGGYNGLGAQGAHWPSLSPEAAGEQPGTLLCMVTTWLSFVEGCDIQYPGNSLLLPHTECQMNP